ncbi:hypothetical protein D3C80_1946780 [compost metagenome]
MNVVIRQPVDVAVGRGGGRRASENRIFGQQIDSVGGGCDGCAARGAGPDVDIGRAAHVRHIDDAKIVVNAKRVRVKHTQ